MKKKLFPNEISLYFLLYNCIRNKFSGRAGDKNLIEIQNSSENQMVRALYTISGVNTLQ